MTKIQISNLENYGTEMETINPCSQFLFGLRVNEIPNKTFILDSHRPLAFNYMVRVFSVLGRLPLSFNLVGALLLRYNPILLSKM